MIGEYPRSIRSLHSAAFVCLMAGRAGGRGKISMKTLARNLRKNLTEAEKLIWRRLRNRQLAGCKFRRQHPIGPYIVDFVCLAQKLVIELDGGQHMTAIGYDTKRSEFLEGKGYRVLRFWNHDVFTDTDTVLQTIYDEVI